MDYQVKLDSFEGPLDLLLHLIRKHEMDVMDIPIAMITDQYLQHIEMMQLLNLDLAGEYILMTATLMHIKSKMLLPPSDEEEGEEDDGDPREELVKRLLEYKKYKEASEELGASEFLGRDNFLRGYYEGLEKDGEEEVCNDVTLFDLIEALQDVLKEVAAHRYHEVAMEEVSVKEKMEVIVNNISKKGSVTFQSLFEKGSSKGQIVATFLALLELIRMKTVRAFQGENFGAIRITRADATIH